MSRSMLMLAAAGAFVQLLTGPAGAADMTMPGGIVRGPLDCGPCGCLTITYVHHRELRSTYGIGFDPRNFDETEPHYYFGAMRAFPRYYVGGVPVPHQCEP